MNSDFKELLQAFAEAEVRYLIVGGYAVIHYAQPRFTKDLDVWLEPSPDNADRVLEAFRQFGIPLLDLTRDDLASPGTQLSVGVAPTELDFLTTVPGLDFAAAWDSRVTTETEGFSIHYVSREDLILAKKTANRPQDLADLDSLEAAED